MLIFNNSKQVTINGQVINRITVVETGDVIYDRKPYRFIKGLYSSKSNAYFSIGVSNLFKIKPKMAMYPIDSRSLIGFNSGKASYFGAVMSDYNYQLEQDTIDGTDCRILNYVIFWVENTWVKLTTVGGELTSTGRIIVSDNFNYPKSIGGDWEGSVYFEDVILYDVDDIIQTTYRPVILEKNIVNGDAGQCGLWDMVNDVFVPHSSPNRFTPIEVADDDEWEPVYGIKAVDGAYLDLMIYIQCNDNFDIEMTTATYDSGGSWQSDGVRRFSDTAGIQISQTTTPDGSKVRLSIVKNDSTNYLVDKAIPANTRFRIHTTNTNMSIDDDIVVETGDRSDDECKLTALLFGVNNSGNVADPSRKILHKFKVDDKDGDGVTHIVPAKITKTGELLFVDLVRGIYIRNANTTETPGYFEEVFAPE